MPRLRRSSNPSFLQPSTALVTSRTTQVNAWTDRYISGSGAVCVPAGGPLDEVTARMVIDLAGNPADDASRRISPGTVPDLTTTRQRPCQAFLCGCW